MDGKLLLDTNILIAVIKGESSVIEMLRDAEQVYVPAVALGELYFGAFNSARREENIARVQGISQNRSVLACDSTTARIYGEIKADLWRVGRPIPENDLWTASIAAQYDLTLISRDDHFEPITTIKHVRP